MDITEFYTAAIIIPLCLVSDGATVRDASTHLSVAYTNPPLRRSPAHQKFTVPRKCGMTYSHHGCTASIQHNVEREKNFWAYTIRWSESSELLYLGFCNSALEAVETVEQRIEALETRNRG